MINLHTQLLVESDYTERSIMTKQSK